jgi:hypothetical protein
MHPGGYCSKDCKTDSDCPSEAICAFDGAVGGCHLICTDPKVCRFSSGYECKPASTMPSSLATKPYCDAKGGGGGGGADMSPMPMPDMSKPTDGATGG